MSDISQRFYVRENHRTGGFVSTFDVMVMTGDGKDAVVFLPAIHEVEAIECCDKMNGALEGTKYFGRG